MAGSATGVGTASATGAVLDTPWAVHLNGRLVRVPAKVRVAGEWVGLPRANVHVWQDTVSTTATATGTGSATATGVVTRDNIATGTGTATALGNVVVAGSATAVGSGAVSATGVRELLGVASAAGAGAATATGVRVVLGTGAASGAATATATGFVTGVFSGTADAIGSGTATEDGFTTHFGTASATGVANMGSDGISTIAGTGDAVASGSASATGTRTVFGTATAAGSGASAATGVRTVPGSGAGSGTGTATATGRRDLFGFGSAAGSGTAAASGSVPSSGYTEPSLVGATTAKINTGGSLTIAYPAGIQAGDRLVLVAACRNSDTNFPVEWTELVHQDTSNGNDFTVIGWTTVDGGEGADLTLSISGNSDATAIMAAFRDAGDPEDSGWIKGGPSTPSLTGTSGGLLVHIGSNVFSSTGYTGFAEGAVTVAATEHETSADTTAIVGYQILDADGATPTADPQGDDDSDDGTAAIAFPPLVSAPVQGTASAAGSGSAAIPVVVEGTAAATGSGTATHVLEHELNMASMDMLTIGSGPELAKGSIDALVIRQGTELAKGSIDILVRLPSGRASGTGTAVASGTIT